MYSREIEYLVQINKGILDSETYARICNTSPQISRVKYEVNENIFKMWVKDLDYPIIFKVIPKKS